MKKSAIFALVCALSLGACQFTTPVPNNPAPTIPPPTVDFAKTADVIAQTSVAQTLTALPSPTIAPATDTATPPIADETTTAVTETLQPNLTTTPATATTGPIDTAPTVTATAAISGSPTPSPTNGVLTYGTLPPANTPFTDATLVNKSKREAYISLQVVSKNGYTIIEYPVATVVKIKIPVGGYTYVAWVGGRQLIGYFNVSQGSNPTINIYKDKIIIVK